MKKAHLPTAELALKDIRPLCDELVRLLDQGWQLANDSLSLLIREPCMQTYAGVVRNHVIGTLEPRWRASEQPRLRVLPNDGIEVVKGRYTLKVRLFTEGEIPDFPMSRLGRAYFRQLRLIEWDLEGKENGDSVAVLAPVNLVLAWDIDRKKGILQCWLVCPDASGNLKSVAWVEPLGLFFEVAPPVSTPTTPEYEDDDLTFLALDDNGESTGADDASNEDGDLEGHGA